MLESLFRIYSLQRPSKNQEKKMRNYIENKIFEEFSEGVYTDSTEINEIIHYCFRLYVNIIHSELSNISSSDLILNLLDDYDKTIEMKKHKRISQNQNVLIDWRKQGPIIRRAIKFMIEDSIINFNDLPKNK